MLALYTLRLQFIYMQSGGFDGDFGAVSVSMKRILLFNEKDCFCRDLFHNVVRH